MNFLKTFVTSASWDRDQLWLGFWSKGQRSSLSLEVRPTFVSFVVLVSAGPLFVKIHSDSNNKSVVYCDDSSWSVPSVCLFVSLSVFLFLFGVPCLFPMFFIHLIISVEFVAIGGQH